MNKQDILQVLKGKNIITQNNKRKFCWKKYWDNEIEEIFNQFKQHYRSDDEAWFCLLHNIEPYKCEICGKLAKFTGSTKSKILGYNTTCENCSPNLAPNKLQVYHESINKRTNEERKQILEKRKQTNLEKYGDENYALFGSKSFKDNLKKKYGYEYNTQIPEIKEKIKQTNLEKYGVTCNLSLLNRVSKQKYIGKIKGNKIREKIKENSLKKYGYDSPNQCPEIIQKQKESLKEHYGSLQNAYKHKYEKNKKTKLEKYGYENYHNKEQMSKTLLERHLNFEKENNCLRYNKVVELYGQGWKSLNIPVIYNGRFRYISNDYISLIKQYSLEIHNIKSQSKKENELYDFIKSLTNTKIIRNNKNIIKDDNQKYEIDIYLPKLNLAFEFNGTYWHSINYKDKYYHQIKTKLCYNKGIQLIHIYEFEWDQNKELIKNRIKELFAGKDCSKYNWVSIQDYSKYILSEPQIINIFHTNKIKFNIYNEGKFIKI